MRKVTMLLVGFLLLAVPAFAQDYAPAEVFGGLSVMRVGETKADRNGTSFSILDSGGMTGWGASVAFNLNPNWAIKADFSGQYASIENTNETMNRYNILGGVQYNIPVEEKVNVFVEGLVGLTTISIPIYTDGSTKGLGMAFGGGVDWKFSEKLHWRVAQAGYTYARVANSNWTDLHAKVNGFRFQTGILIPLGK